MKYINIVIILFAVIINSNVVLAQELTPEQKQQIIGNLDSSDFGLRFDAIKRILEYQITEAVPKLEANIWSEEVTLKFWYLDALLKFNSPNLHNILLSFIDSAAAFATRGSPSERDTLEIKVQTSRFLIKLNDYSGIPYIFEILKRDSSKVNNWALDVLKDIHDNVPAYAESAKIELMRIARVANFYPYRYHALYQLTKISGNEIIPELLYHFTNDADTEGSMKLLALEYLFKLNYPELHSLLINRLTNEPLKSYRVDIAESLLVHYGKPLDYKIVMDYQPNEPEGVQRRLIGYELEEFKPPIPADSILISIIIDTLSATVEQVKLYNWLGDQSFVASLDSNLNSAKNYLVAGDSINCARQIKLFQQKADEEYRDSLDGDNKTVTIEGWKFLYYNAKYILDRLPTPPHQYKLNINTNGDGTKTHELTFGKFDHQEIDLTE